MVSGRGPSSSVDGARLDRDFADGQVRRALDDLDRRHLVAELAGLHAPRCAFRCESQRELVLRLARRPSTAAPPSRRSGPCRRRCRRSRRVGEDVRVEAMACCRIIGTMLMHSVPAAIITSASPTRMRSAAICSADRPEAQKRLTVMPPTRLRQAGQQRARCARCSGPARLRESRSRRSRPRSRAGSSAGTCASATCIAATSRSSGRVLRKKPRCERADRRARGGDDVGVLELFCS